jgi:hypothetical protein
MPHLPGELDPSAVQQTRDTPGRRSSERSTFGTDETARRGVAVDAMRMGHSIDAGLEPKPGHPGRPRTERPDPEEELAVAESERIFPTRDEEPDPIPGQVVAFAEDDDGAETVGPFIAGALAGEAMLRSGDVTFEGYDDEPEPFDDESEAVYIDVDTGEPIDPAALDEYEVIDEGGGLPPTA